MNVSAVCIGCSLSFRSTSRFGSFCVCTLGCRVVAHENVSFNRMARRGAEPLARATTCTQNTMHRPPGALNTHGSTEHTHEHEQRRPCTRHTRVRRRPPYGFLSHTHVSVNCALNKGAVLLCSCSYAGSPCEIASRLPSVRIYHASDGPLRPRANQHIRFGLRSSSRSLASSPRCALCVQRRPQLLAGSRRRGRCPPEKPRRGGRCGSCFRYLRNGQVPMVAVLYNSWLFLWWFETEPRLPARCPL